MSQSRQLAAIMFASHNVNLLTLTMALTALTTFTALPQTGVNPERLSEIPVRIQQFVNEGVISGAVMLLALNGEIVLHLGHRHFLR